jgi:hypothetical protein
MRYIFCETSYMHSVDVDLDANHREVYQWVVLCSLR